MTKQYGAALLSLLLGASMPLPAATRPAEPALSYRLTEGQNINAFVRDGKVAAHLLLRSGRDPRILIAFPAGNSGVGLWFAPVDGGAQWRLDSGPQPVTLRDAKSRPLYGIRVVATIAVRHLTVKQAVLSNVRILRDYQAIGKMPAEVAAPAQAIGRTLDFHRDRLDGAPGYRLTLRVLSGSLGASGINAAPDGRIRLEIVAASGDPPLTPLFGAALLKPTAAADPAARHALEFLSYREKFLAGSWRFNTYFGRDTLMAVRLLMPALQPPAVEAGLSSVLARLSPGGEVAHEEGIGEFAVLEHKANDGSIGDTASLDYKMVDDDFMLAPVMAHYVLDTTDGRARAARYLAQPAGGGRRQSVGAALVGNLRFVFASATAFAADPRPAALVSIKPGFMAGQWRDSDEGLGRGRYAYDVNAVFVPAALAAIDRLAKAGLLDRYLTPADRTAFAQAGRMAAVWHGKAPPLFATSVPAAAARQAITSYAASAGVAAGPALAALDGAALTFHALSLGAAGKPVPVINSDEGFALLFGDPPPADLDTYVTAIMRPFPAGLMTDVGLLVANPVLAGPDAQARLGKNAYHGAVVWSWQQALLAAGLERQLARRDLPPPVRIGLVAAQARLWWAITATRAVQSSELWSWSYADGRYTVAPFGSSGADADESNAAQLWSTVYLAVQPPR